MDAQRAGLATLIGGLLWYALVWFGHERGYASRRLGVIRRVPRGLSRFMRYTDGPLLTWSVVNQAWAGVLMVVGTGVALGLIQGDPARAAMGWAWYGGLVAIGAVWLVLALVAARNS